MAVTIKHIKARIKNLEVKLKKHEGWEIELRQAVQRTLQNIDADFDSGLDIEGWGQDLIEHGKKLNDAENNIESVEQELKTLHSTLRDMRIAEYSR